MNKKELYHFLPSLVFLVVLGIMALILLFGPDKDYSANEKRYLAGRPEATLSNILKGKTQEELEEFTADQIPGRDFFVGVNAYWNLATGRNAAQSIYHGKDGYLINAPKTYNEEVFTNNLTTLISLPRAWASRPASSWFPPRATSCRTSCPLSTEPMTTICSMKRPARY